MAIFHAIIGFDLLFLKQFSSKPRIIIYRCMPAYLCYTLVQESIENMDLYRTYSNFPTPTPLFLNKNYKENIPEELAVS